jgi:hypothetical protein
MGQLAAAVAGQLPVSSWRVVGVQSFRRKAKYRPRSLPAGRPPPDLHGALRPHAQGKGEGSRRSWRKSAAGRSGAHRALALVPKRTEEGAGSCRFREYPGFDGAPGQGWSLRAPRAFRRYLRDHLPATGSGTHRRTVFRASHLSADGVGVAPERMDAWPATIYRALTLERAMVHPRFWGQVSAVRGVVPQGPRAPGLPRAAG